LARACPGGCGVSVGAEMEGGIAAYFRAVAVAPARLLMLDYDGTLAPFVLHRLRARPYPGVLRRLERLADGCRTRLVLVSGRRVRELTRLLPLPASVEVWGSHGWERRMPRGQTLTCVPERRVQTALDRAAEIAEDLDLGAYLERKVASVALHWRGVTRKERHLLALDGWEDLARECALELTSFEEGVEFGPVGQGKHVAVKTLLGEMPAGTAAAFLGDDATDEAAFEALGDTGLGVLVRECPRPSKAALWISAPLGVLDFLDRWGEASGYGI
jgi:trehalose 6-phosphate phosphatase